MKIFFTIAALLLAFVALYAHGGEKHEKENTQPTTSTPSEQPTDTMKAVEHDHEAMMASMDTSGYVHDETKVTADFSEFPSLHPMIVHWAIVLLSIGAALQLANVFFMRREVAWTALFIVMVGLAVAYVAANNFHPHTDGLNEHAKLVLQQHDQWADWTLNLGLAGFILQCANLFVFRSKRWAVLLVAVVLVGAGLTVGLTGHYGAQLVHIEGVGPQGKYLEMEPAHDH